MSNTEYGVGLLKNLQLGRTPAKGSLRPLRKVSDFTAGELGRRTGALAEGTLDPVDLIQEIDDLVRDVPTNVIVDLQRKPGEYKRAAMIDLVFLRRAVDVAKKRTHIADPKKSALDVYTTTLAHDLGRPPYLIWPDTANYFPFSDPRSFLEPGLDREQEIKLYILNGGVDLVFQSIVTQDYTHGVTVASINQMSEHLGLVAQSMRAFSKEREPGHFDRLAPFSGTKDREERIPASGDFSVWSYFAGLFLTGRETFKKRLLDRRNWSYFDRDALPLITKLEEGNLKTLKDIINSQTFGREKSLLTGASQEAAANFDAFYAAHHAAVAAHARDLLVEKSHIDMGTNQVSIMKAKGK